MAKQTELLRVPASAFGMPLNANKPDLNPLKDALNCLVETAFGDERPLIDVTLPHLGFQGFIGLCDRCAPTCDPLPPVPELLDRSGLLSYIRTNVLIKLQALRLNPQRENPMEYKPTVETLPQQHTASVRTRTPVTELSRVLGESYARVMAAVQQSGTQISGPPFALYHNMDMDDLDIEIGFIVKEAVSVAEEVDAGEIPAGQYATCVHTGSYETIEAAYTALGEWVASQSYTTEGKAYELYLNDPGETPPEALETKILFPLQEP